MLQLGGSPVMGLEEGHFLNKMNKTTTNLLLGHDYILLFSYILTISHISEVASRTED